MRKRVFIMFVLSMLVLAACSGNKETQKEVDDNNSSEAKEEAGIEVEKGLLNVEVTLPEMFFKDENVEEMIEESLAEGVKEATENEDGSVTFKMSKKDHKKMLTEMSEEIEGTVDEISNDENFTSIQDITYNKKFTEFTMVVEREVFENSFDGFAVLGLGFSGMFYQVFSGEDIESAEVTVYIEDEETGEVFKEVVYPEAFEELEE